MSFFIDRRAFCRHGKLSTRVGAYTDTTNFSFFLTGAREQGGQDAAQRAAVRTEVCGRAIHSCPVPAHAAAISLDCRHAAHHSHSRYDQRGAGGPTCGFRLAKEQCAHCPTLAQDAHTQSPLHHHAASAPFPRAVGARLRCAVKLGPVMSSGDDDGYFGTLEIAIKGARVPAACGQRRRSCVTPEMRCRLDAGTVSSFSLAKWRAQDGC